MADFNFDYKPKETLTKKFNFRMKASTDERLNELVASEKIKSKGDLINKLLEDFLDEYDRENEEK